MKLQRKHYTKNDIKERASASLFFAPFAILFILFDIEAVFMYPWAVSVRELGWFGFTEMVVFMLLLLTGLIYILKKGVLNWR